MHRVTAMRMISGLDLKYLNGPRVFIRKRYETAPTGSRKVRLT